MLLSLHELLRGDDAALLLEVLLQELLPHDLQLTAQGVELALHGLVRGHRGQLRLQLLVLLAPARHLLLHVVAVDLERVVILLQLDVGLQDPLVEVLQLAHLSLQERIVLLH